MRYFVRDSYMTRFHVNDKGEAGLCRAKEGNCPLSGESNHYSSLDDARKGYEEKMSELHEPKGLRKISKYLKKAVGLPAQEPPTNYPKFKADSFTTMVGTFSKAATLNATNTELDAAEFLFVKEGALSGETSTLPDYFKEVYSEPSLINSVLTLKDWKPSSNTQKFIVHELVTSSISHHFIALTNAGLRRNRFLETIQGLTGNPVGVVNQVDNIEGKISSYDEGWIAGYQNAAKEAMAMDFPVSSSYGEQMRHLRKFIEDRAVLMEVDWALKEDDAKGDFAAGLIDSHTEWLNEDLDWEVDPKEKLYE